MSADNIQKSQVIYRRQFLTEAESTPKFPKYASVFEREKSYETWENISCLSKDKLIAAGFFYAGIEDTTYCFQCGKTLKNWGVNDDPLKEHATHNPRCPFIRELLGEGSVRRRSRILDEEQSNGDHDDSPMLVSIIKGMSAKCEELIAKIDELTQANEILKRTVHDTEMRFHVYRQNIGVRQARMRNTVTVEGSYTEDPSQTSNPAGLKQMIRELKAEVQMYKEAFEEESRKRTLTEQQLQALQEQHIGTTLSRDNGMPTATVPERLDVPSQALVEWNYSPEQISHSKEIFKERNDNIDEDDLDVEEEVTSEDGDGEDADEVDDDNDDGEVYDEDNDLDNLEEDEGEEVSNLKLLQRQSDVLADEECNEGAEEEEKLENTEEDTSFNQIEDDIARGTKRKHDDEVEE